MANMLFVNLTGIGNCILSTPTIAALHAMGHTVDVLVAREKFSAVAFLGWDAVHAIHYDSLPAKPGRYDLALWGHPIFAGEFHPPCPVDSVDPQPGSLEEYHWRFQKHEVLEVLELARRLGFAGPVPPLRPPPREPPDGAGRPQKVITVGIGYTKAGDWHKKHWGNANYIALGRAFQEAGYWPILVGDDEDQHCNGATIASAGIESICGKLPITKILGVVSNSVAYVGNDTGFMHAATAYGIPTIGIFTASNPVKNSPWGPRGACVDGTVPPREIVDLTLQLLAQPD